jgi:antitoxin component of MazEF toxin-antitoxin module
MTEIPYTARVRKQGSSLVISIPKEVTEIAEIKDGDFVISIFKEKIRISALDGFLSHVACEV